MISAIYTPTTQNPSFKGIVKVNKVFVNGIREYDEFKIKAACQRVKDLLMKQDGIVPESYFTQHFRKLFNYFDNDYKIPLQKIKGDTRNFFYRIKSFNSFFFISAKDAQKVATAGEIFGTERTNDAAKLYSSAIAGISKKFFGKDSKIPTKKPFINIYTYKDTRGTIRLSAVEIGNADVLEEKIKFCEIPTPKTKVKLKKPTIISSSKQNNITTVQPTQQTPVKTEINKTLEELSKKTWHFKKKPIQMEFEF